MSSLGSKDRVTLFDEATDPDLELRILPPTIETHFLHWIESVRSYDGTNELQIFELLQDLLYFCEEDLVNRDILRHAVIQSAGLMRYITRNKVNIYVQGEFRYGTQIEWVDNPKGIRKSMVI